MTNPTNSARGRTRGVSPTMSDTSELTVLSRTPSPAVDYDTVLMSPRKSRDVSSTSSDVSEPTASPQKLRSPDGRFIARGTKRAPSLSPERPAKRTRRLTISQQKAKLKRTRNHAEPTSPMAKPASPLAWVVGEGGFGSLEKLPIEIRQEIYAYAFDTKIPVTLKTCCGLTTTRRERDACRKHGLSAGVATGRFNMLQVSKAMRQEVMWVIYNQSSLSLETIDAIAPYLKGCPSKSQRGVTGFIQNHTRKSAMWHIVSQFRFTTIEVPEEMVQYGDPTIFTDRLLGIATLLCTEPHHAHAVKRSIHINLGSIFHQMLPFNMESQAEPRYGELLDWLCVHYPYRDPDLDKVTSESEHNLHRLLHMIGKNSECLEWRVFANTKVHKDDEGGEKALQDFQIGCAKNGVVFEHMD